MNEDLKKEEELSATLEQQAKYTNWEEEAMKRADKSKQDILDSWIVDLEEKDQPEACSIDDEDCEACGS